MVFEDVRSKGFTKRVKLSDAIERCISAFNPFPTQTIELRYGPINGRILREDTKSWRPVPPFDRSAVDGYAIRGEDSSGATETTPVALRVVGNQLVGRPPSIPLGPGEAISIATGAPMPDGADSVVMIEDTERTSNEEVELYSSAHAGKNISKAGEDVMPGVTLLKAGHRLRSGDRGFFLSAGVREIVVSSIPKVGIMTVGDELRPPWNDFSIGQIPEVNTLNLYDMCLDLGWSPKNLGILEDREDDIRSLVAEASNEFDVLLLSGGTSVGEKDYIPVVLNDLGSVLFHGVAMRPGGPVIGAKVNNSIVFGLPGFPAATIIAFIAIVKPVISVLLGATDKGTRTPISAQITRSVPSKSGRIDFLRVSLRRSSTGEFHATPLEIGGSGLLSSIVRADGIVLIPEEIEGIKQGAIVDVFLLDQ